MKKIAVLSLALTMSTAFAAQEFGGIQFHSSVPQDQVNAIKVDLKYLFKAPVTKPLPAFASMSRMTVTDGPNMHNWLVNRAKYVVGETYELNNDNVVAQESYKFPNTPLPGGFSAIEENDEVTTVMSNIGTAIYLIGKKEKVLFGIKFDDSKVFSKSPRAGILKVGRGLFLEKFAINKDMLSPANSISRLGTLFHEARHSDGNSAHTGFTHAICPDGHPYATHAACESTSNGPYSLGGLSEVHMLQNCASCSTQDKTVLSARAADSFNRVLDVGLENQKHALKAQIQKYSELIAAYEELAVKYPDRAYMFETELKKLKRKNAELSVRLAVLQNQKPSTTPKDPTPEGEFNVVSLKDSMMAMEKGLKK